MMGRTEVVAILKDLMEGARLDVAWGPMDPQPRASVRMAFLALQCMENAMPYGGRIEISQENNQWLLFGRAEKLNIDEDIWSILTTKEPPGDLRPAHVQFALLPLIAGDLGRRISTEVEEKVVKLRF